MYKGITFSSLDNMKIESLAGMEFFICAKQDFLFGSVLVWILERERKNKQCTRFKHSVSTHSFP